MLTAFRAFLTSPEEEAVGRRAIGLVAAILVNLALLLMLLTLAPDVPGRKDGDGVLRTFSVAPPAPEPVAEPEHEQPETKPTERRPTPPPPDVPAIPPPPVPPTDLGLIYIPRQEIAQLDRVMRAPPIERPVRAESSASSEARPGDTPVASGKGPQGQTLYRADWYREPTQAELATYMPSSIPPGAFGTIACRTAPRYRVEDCVAIEENPPGSGLSRSVLNASWQFRVLPPRLGGKQMIGEWVAIRIVYRDLPKEGR